MREQRSLLATFDYRRIMREPVRRDCPLPAAARVARKPSFDSGLHRSPSANDRFGHGAAIRAC